MSALTQPVREYASPKDEALQQEQALEDTAVRRTSLDLPAERYCLPVELATPIHLKTRKLLRALRHS